MKPMQTKWENVNFLQEGDAPNKFKKKSANWNFNQHRDSEQFQKA